MNTYWYVVVVFIPLKNLRMDLDWILWWVCLLWCWTLRCWSKFLDLYSDRARFELLPVQRLYCLRFIRVIFQVFPEKCRVWTLLSFWPFPGPFHSTFRTHSTGRYTVRYSSLTNDYNPVSLTITHLFLKCMLQFIKEHYTWICCPLPSTLHIGWVPRIYCLSDLYWLGCLYRTIEKLHFNTSGEKFIKQWETEHTTRTTFA
jgi:hypothetical protein